MYAIYYHKKALKQINKLPMGEKYKIVEKIHQLASNPYSENLNIKRFTKTEKSFRLRIGNIRIIYELDLLKKIILVRKIGYRGDVYKH